MRVKLLKKIRKRFILKVINFNEGRAVKILDLKNKESHMLRYDTSEITDVLLSVGYSKRKAEKRRKRINFKKELNKL